MESKTDPRTVRCATCGALPGEPCRSVRARDLGRPITGHHAFRELDARPAVDAVAMYLPRVTIPATDPGTDRRVHVRRRGHGRRDRAGTAPDGTDRRGFTAYGGRRARPDRRQPQGGTE